MDKRKHVKLYTGSLITLRGLANLLETKNISSLVKNVFESAILGGYGASDTSNELWVYEEDYEAAKTLLDEYLKDS